MKTCQAVAYSVQTDLQNVPEDSTKVIAVERNAKRCQVLEDLLVKHGADPYVHVLNQDFLRLDPHSHPQVEYVIVDPTCSGSGTLDSKQHDSDNTAARLQKLQNLQVMILKHALTFPNVKRVAYSTCSVNKKENEDVVREVLNDSDFKLAKNILPTWERRGADEEDKSSKKMVRADPIADLCTGFFVAVFKRKSKKS